MKVSRGACVAVVGLAAMLAACVARAADGPSFDRPGIGFGTTTLPVGGFAWEQGLPDVELSDQNGVRTRRYVAATLLRLGLDERLELQLSIDAYQRLSIDGQGARVRAEGSGDAGIGLKWALPTAVDGFTWAVLASATLPSGEAPFSADDEHYDISLATQWDLGDEQAIALYLDRSFGEQHGWMFSPSYSFAVSETLGAYIEAGFGAGDDRSRAVGAGLTWQATPRLQLDVSALRGLNRESADWQGGFGISVYFP